MAITQNAIADPAYARAVAAREHAAHALYQAEVAVHDAHQTHVDEWIGVAHDRLHAAITRYTAASALVSAVRHHGLAA